MSKLAERIVCSQLNEHAKITGNTELLQSAYKADHSTETTLLKVKTDMLRALDNKEVMCLVPLDLTSAFNMIEQ